MPHSVDWARQLKEQLQDEIRILGARAREGSLSPRTPDYLAEEDRLQDLRQRLVQVERLIEVVSEADPGAETGWPAHLDDTGSAGSAGEPSEAPSR